MAKCEKLLLAILNSAKDVRFEDACKVAELLGFTGIERKGSHNGYARPGEIEQLDFQNRGGKIPPYQAKQLQRMILKYWDFENDASRQP